MSYHTFFTKWPLWSWYSYPAPVLLFSIIPGLSHLPAPDSRNLKMSIGVVGANLLLLVGGQRGLFHYDDPEKSYKVQNRSVALQLNKKIGNKRVAMGDRAGSFAFFYDGPVTQLEGLVGSYEVAKSLLAEQAGKVLDSHGVKYIVAWAEVPDQYETYALETVRPGEELQGIPESQIKVRSRDEIIRRHTPAGTIVVWKLRNRLDGKAAR
ncbi:hypothetical protein GGP86_001420 [Salinibacter ruber]|uniref:hypothetical protein n=1 Tax=Salinibacter ruber TaxID=146919 RepID=UPI0021685B43|nr:hypothetical protein [Salinibacter ruber]MCS3861642.1 hypothetical protein [Salinibacter ruber]